MCTANSRSEVIQRSWTALRNCNKTLTARKELWHKMISGVCVPGQAVPRCTNPCILQGLDLVFDLQEAAAESPSRVTAPGQASWALLPATALCSSCPQLKAAAQLSLFTCAQIQGGKGNIKQIWALLKWLEDAIGSRGCVVPLRLVCL